MTTKTLTFEQVIAANRETLDYLLDQDVAALTPALLVEELTTVGREFSSSFESTNQANGEAFTAAAAYLADTLTLDPNDPNMPVLLGHVRRHLLDAEI